MSKNKRVSIKTKLLRDVYLNTTITLLVALLALFFISYFELRKHSQEYADTLARTAALLINGDEYERSSSGLEGEGNAKDTLLLLKQANPEMKSLYTTGKRDKFDDGELVVNGVGDGKNGQITGIFDSSVFSEAPIKNKAGQYVGTVHVGIDADMMIEHEKQLLVSGLLVFLCSVFFTSYFSNKRISKIMMPLQEINNGIAEAMDGRLQYRINIRTGDEFEDVGKLINKFSDVMVDYTGMLERDLEAAQEQKETLFKAYSRVIHAITQGRFNLISDAQPLFLEKAGELMGEVILSSPETVREARDYAENLLQQKNLSPKTINRILLCISEASTNAIKHAGKGVMQIGKVGNNIRVIVYDRGSGMDFDKLPKMIFLNGFSTKISMGFGFTLIYKYVDTIYLSTSKHGTFIAMDFNE